MTVGPRWPLSRQSNWGLIGAVKTLVQFVECRRASFAITKQNNWSDEKLMKWMATLRNGLMLGSVVATAACVDPESASVCKQSLGIETQEGINGQGGTNGLKASDFHKYFQAFLEVTKLPLAQLDVKPVGGKYPINPVISSGFLKNGEDYAVRHHIFEKAIQCALPRMMNELPKESVSLEDSDKKTNYPGGGLMKTTTSWLTTALDQQAMEDVVTCMVLLLNPHYKGVPVFLSGPSVSEDGQIGALPDYPFEEAIWAVDVSEIVTYHVWPLFKGPQFREDCSWGAPRPEAPWEYRVCGTTDGNCGVDVRFDRLDEECEKILDKDKVVVEGHYMCGAKSYSGELGVTRKPAIQTMLKTKCDLNALFCPIPQ